MTGRIAKP